MERVFLEDVARRGLGRFVGLADGGELQALCHVGVNAVPSGQRLRRLRPRGRACLAANADRRGGGGRRAVGRSALAAATAPRGPSRTARLRPPRAPPEGGTGLRAAPPEDLELLIPACAAAHEQEIGVDPLQRDPEGFRWRTRTQIEEGRSWLWAEDGVILFKAEASAWTPSAVQLQQVWVDPAARRQGYGARGLRDLCRLLLERVPAVCLFVRAENQPAIRLYESVGMKHVLDYRSVFSSRGDAPPRASRARRVESTQGPRRTRPRARVSRRRASSRRAPRRARWRARSIDLGVATELRRTQETLELALVGRDVPRLVVPELNEIHFGSFDGGPSASTASGPAPRRRHWLAPGGGESRAHAAARYRARAAVRARSGPGERVSSIGHALVVRYVLDAARGWSRRRGCPLPSSMPRPHRLDARREPGQPPSSGEWSLEPRFRDVPRRLEAQ